MKSYRTQDEYGTMSSPLTGSSVELVIRDEKPSCLKPWMKVLIALGLLALLTLALAVGIYFSLLLWSGMGEWVNTPCGTEADAAACPASYSKTPITILISLDGFRASYLLKNVTPTFERFKKCGVSAPYMRPVYPTKTFPNHYSMATGLFTESSGIIANQMYDEGIGWVYRNNNSQRSNPAWWGGDPGLFPAFNGLVGNTMYDEDIGKVFKLSNTEKFNPQWYQGDPIWNTVTKNNKTSASYFWVGSDVPIEGMYPKYYKNYTKGIPYEDEVDEVLKWINLPEDQRPNFITMYFDQPDGDGHKYGPDSPEVRKEIEYVDSIIGMLMNGLVEREIHNCVNVIVVADHGMSETSCDRVALVKDYVNITNMYVYSGTFGRINTKYFIGRTTANPFSPPLRDQQEIVNSLRCANSHLQTQFKWDLPKRFHYAYNKRIEDIVMNVDDGWLVGRTSPKDACYSIGNHGFDDAYKSMEAIFMAHGPSFKSNYEVEPFLNIELYNLLTELVNITGSPNNGTDGSLHHMLRHPSSLPPRDGGLAYDNCSFPTDPTEYHNRATAQAACTICTMPAGESVQTIDDRLNINVTEAKGIIDLHIPSGEPFLQGLGSVCTLSQQDYVQGYSEIFHSPIWSAYRLDKSYDITNMTSEPCLRPDVRLAVGVEANCSDFKAAFGAENITSGFLHPPEFSTNDTAKLDSHILSNVVPMYEGFKSGIWQYLLNKLSKWEAKHGPLHVISGPIYDYDYDGHYDDLTKIKSFLNNNNVPIPTHYYTIVIKPRDNTESTNRKNDVMAFILPNKNEPTTCQPKDVYLFLHAARVKDVELLTGLEFFPKFDRYEALSLQTFLMDELWTI